MDTQQLTTTFKRLQQGIDEKTLTRLARESGFTERLRSVEPYPLLLALFVALGAQKTETIADILRTFNALTGKDMAYKPFHKKLTKPAFAELMRQVVEHLVSQLALRVLKPKPGTPVHEFEDIVLQDGTSFALKSSLRGDFPGRFTDVSPAAVEVHATFHVGFDQPTVLHVEADSVGERQFRPAPCDLQGVLFLGDRGYQDLEYCRQVAEAGGSVLIRHQSRINPTVVDCYTGGRRPRKLRGRSLQPVQSKLRGQHADLDVEWSPAGGAPLLLRVLLLWNPQRGDHTVLVTNLARSRFAFDDVAQLYRLRWQVELLFKEWKSYANLHAFDTGKEPLATGLIWASLATAVLKRFFAHATQMTFPGTPTSTRRAAMAISHHLRPLLLAFLHREGMRDAFQRMLRFLSTQARRAHPRRDQTSGRLYTGLEPNYAIC